MNMSQPDITPSTTNATPVVSVGMPVYNGEDHLRDALD